GGRWCYLYMAITAGGQTLDFYLSPKWNVAAAKRFLAKAVRSRQDNKQDELLTPSKTKVRKPRAGVRRRNQAVDAPRLNSSLSISRGVAPPRI
ncbi:DDE-type integrase/transposase/recombinase, partial [Corynebacterium kefirresidentii]